MPWALFDTSDAAATAAAAAAEDDVISRVCMTHALLLALRLSYRCRSTSASWESLNVVVALCDSAAVYIPKHSVLTPLYHARDQPRRRKTTGNRQTIEKQRLKDNFNVNCLSTKQRDFHCRLTEKRLFTNKDLYINGRYLVDWNM